MGWLDIFDACLCLQTNFPKVKVLPEKTETIFLQVVFHGFTRAAEQFIAQQDKKEKWVCISTQLYTFDGVENVKSLDGEYSFSGHGRSIVPVWQTTVLISASVVLSSVVYLVLKPSLPPSPLVWFLSLFGDITVFVGSASIWPRSSEWVFSLKAFWRQFPGQGMEINHGLKHQISEEQSVIVCV